MTYIVIKEYEYSEDTSFEVFKTLDDAKDYVMTINPEAVGNDDLIGVHIAELNTSIKIRDSEYSISDMIDELEKGKE